MTTAPNNAAELPDVQESPETRGIAIDFVGVKSVAVPVFNGFGVTIGRLTVLTDLAADRRGVHMSRMVRPFFDLLAVSFRNVVGAHTLAGMLADIVAEQGALIGAAWVEFESLANIYAPESLKLGLAPYTCRYGVEILSEGYAREWFGVTVRGATLCPCSKEISDNGAHNQRAVVTADVARTPAPIRRAASNAEPEHPREFLEIRSRLLSACSIPLIPVLKRTDEKHVTELAYARPRFVEDVVREAITPIRALFPHAGRLSSRNEESIHDHDAYAEISWSDSEDRVPPVWS